MRSILPLPTLKCKTGFDGSAQRLRWLTERADEGAAHALGIAKSRTGSDVLDRLRATFDPLASDFEPEAFDGLGGSHAGLPHKCSRKMAWAHRCAVGQALNWERLVEMLSRPGEQGPEATI